MSRISRADNPTKHPIPLTRHAVRADDIRAIAERVEGTGLGGSREALEERLSVFTGRAHAIATNSLSSALELAFEALGRSERPTHPSRTDGLVRGRVILPAAGFPAAASAVARRGAVLEPVDIDAQTWNLDLDAAERVLAERASRDRAWTLVHQDLHGAVTDIGRLLDATRAADARLVRDASGSLGGFAASGAAATGQCDLVVLALGTPDEAAISAGAVLCDDPEIASRVRTLANLGRVPGRHEVAIPGTDARLSDLAASLALARIDRLQAAVNERRLLAAGYRERLAEPTGRGLIRWQEHAPGARPACTGLAILLAENLPGRRDRVSVCAHLAERGIESGPAALALHRMAGFAHLPGIAGRTFPVAQALHDRGLSLPLFSGMRSAELDRVCDALSEALS